VKEGGQRSVRGALMQNLCSAKRPLKSNVVSGFDVRKIVTPNPNQSVFRRAHFRVYFSSTPTSLPLPSRCQGSLQTSRSEKKVRRGEVRKAKPLSAPTGTIWLLNNKLPPPRQTPSVNLIEVRFANKKGAQGKIFT
jgi:hypothetical protein